MIIIIIVASHPAETMMGSGDGARPAVANLAALSLGERPPRLDLAEDRNRSGRLSPDCSGVLFIVRWRRSWGTRHPLYFPAGAGLRRTKSMGGRISGRRLAHPSTSGEYSI